jgi:tetratricopeptide (TPR) repeat protein
MPEYLLSGTDADGRSVTESVVAPSADEAVQRYRARGYADVVLHSDEVMGHLLDPRVLEHMTPRDYLALGRVSRFGFVLRTIWRLYRQQWYLFALMALLLIGRRVMEAPWDILDNLGLALFFMPPVFVLLGEVVSPSRKFERAMSFAAWGRWAQMLAALPAVRSVVPEMQFAFFEAKALAGLGRLDEAMEKVRPYADDPDTPPWLYWGSLADMFTAAHLGDRAIEALQKAHEHASDNVTILIDLALCRLRYRRDAAGARPLLEEARRHEVPEPLVPFLLAAEGMLALEERRPEDARRLLEESLQRSEPLRHMSPLLGAAIDRTHAYLCLACAAAGDVVSAARHFRQAEPRMRAFGAEDLLERCRAALGERV